MDLVIALAFFIFWVWFIVFVIQKLNNIDRHTSVIKRKLEALEKKEAE